MPVLQKIVIQDFRNIALQEIVFSHNINCISGGNGEGKTNLLDAVWYLSMTKSAVSGPEQYNYRHGTDSLGVSGTYRMENGTVARFAIQSGNEGKKVRRDDKQYGKVSDHIGVIPIVMVSPADTSMVSESGEERRRFVNSVLSQMDRQYLSDLQQYNRLLLQRNKLLKSGCADDLLLETIDERMSAAAAPIYEARKRFTSSLAPIVSEFHERISGGRESVGIEYVSDLAKGSLSELLSARREKDKMLGYTGTGIQRDDFVFTMDGHPIRRCGSQGQQKSFLVSLKFAQYELMKENCGFPPILLLDDLFDKLDMDRVGNLLKMVAGNDFGQIFLTDSNKTRIRSIVDSITADRRYIEAKGGVFTVLDE